MDGLILANFGQVERSEAELALRERLDPRSRANAAWSVRLRLDFPEEIEFFWGLPSGNQTWQLNIQKRSFSWENHP